MAGRIGGDENEGTRIMITKTFRAAGWLPAKVKLPGIVAVALAAGAHLLNNG
jgi:hypothetical protein